MYCVCHEQLFTQSVITMNTHSNTQISQVPRPHNAKSLTSKVGIWGLSDASECGADVLCSTLSDVFLHYKPFLKTEDQSKQRQAQRQANAMSYWSSKLWNIAYT